MSFLLDDGLRQWFYTSPHVKEALPRLRKDVEDKKTSPTAAADSLLNVRDAKQALDIAADALSSCAAGRD